MTIESHILVVDDDRRIRQLLTAYLAGRGYRVTGAATAREARDHLHGLVFDLIILDVMMPGESGVSLAKDLRGLNHEVPILMLSALTDAKDRIAGLSAGSDDYLGKPFEPEELLLRVQSLLRRSAPDAATPSVVQFGAFTFAIDSGELARLGERLRLTSRERDLLRVLAQSGGRPVARNLLASPRIQEAPRAVDVQINRLRQKIEADPSNPAYLQTVRGEGYALIIDHGARS